MIRIDAPSIALPWYLGYLRARYPALHVPDAAAGATNDEIVMALVRANLRDRVFYISKRPSIAPPENLEWVPAGGLWKLDARAAAAEVDPRDWEYPYRNDRPFDQPARHHAPQRTTGPNGETRVVREPYTGQIRRFHLQAHKNLGDWQLAHGRYAEAVAAYERLFALDPALDHPGVLFAMGKALFAAGRNAEAQAYFEHLSGHLDPAASADAFLYLGQIHAAAGRRDRAREYFDALKRIAPELWKQNEGALVRLGSTE